MPKRRATSAGIIRVVVEGGSKRSFASAVDWPGWARSGRDEPAAVAALLVYASRYASVVARAKLGFVSPVGTGSLHVIERLPGNATTEFGAPGVAATVDATVVDAAELARLRKLLTASWRAFDAGVASARGKSLRPGPRGGGRPLEAIVDHVRDAEAGYLSALGWPFKGTATGRGLIVQTRAAVLDGLAASVDGEIAARGPRGGVRWKPRFFARRLMWHALDHLWEIEDRSTGA
ncbi:MAG TPA: hypothetical protein VF001_05565 [Candidatus Limnocylindria bacterium]